MIASLNQEKCAGCRLCVEICPMDVFRMVEETNVAFIRYPQDCQTCFQCELTCPVDAIYVDPRRVRALHPLISNYSGKNA